MDKRLLPCYIEDLRRSGLRDEMIAEFGFYLGTAAEVRAIVSLDAEPALAILHTPVPVKPDPALFDMLIAYPYRTEGLGNRPC